MSLVELDDLIRKRSEIIGRSKNASLVDTGKAERIASFKEKFVCDFKGTINKPLNLETLSKGGKIPTPNDIYANIPTLEEYIKSPKSAVVYKQYHAVKLPDTIWTNKIENGIEDADYNLLSIDPKTGISIFHTEGIPGAKLTYAAKTYLETGNNVLEDTESGFQSDTDTDYIRSYENGYDTIGAILLNDTLILNADEDASEHDFVGSDAFEKYPCLSFKCLTNLLADEVIENISEQRKRKILTKRDYKVIDFSAAETKPISKALQAELTKARRTKNFDFRVWAAKQTPPSPGFSLIDGSPVQWHKSPTVLITHKTRTFLMGQDEGTYFGCILADNPATLEQAFISLMPEQARGVKGVLRQGEWFAIPVKNQKSVPDKYSPETIFYTDLENAEIPSLNFGIEDKDSNRHEFNGELIVTRSGNYYARNFSVFHVEHATLAGEQNVWYTFARNTALSSYSAEKVD